MPGSGCRPRRHRPRRPQLRRAVRGTLGAAPAPARPVLSIPTENLRHVGWQAYRVESYVNWCGHAQEVIPIVDRSGGLHFIPVLGEAR
jgi:hypothetical protein